MEDEVIAEFGLSEKQSMLTTRLFPFPISKEGREGSQPLLTAGQYIASRKGISQLL
jgi:hypothetical protein